MVIQEVIDTEKKAGVFVCDSTENFYWCIKHLERFKEIADDNQQMLKITAVYLPKIS